jgi:hypothetical protein
MFDRGVVPAELAAVDPSLPAAERVEGLLAAARARAQIAAFEQRTLAAASVAEASVAWMSGSENKQWLREQLALALTITCDEVANRFAVAATLVDRLPTTLGVLERGGPDYHRARMIAEAVYGLDDATAVEQRGVWATYHDDGTAELGASATADRVRAVMALLDDLAAASKDPGETRTADQRRSDALMELASGGMQARGPRITVTVALTTHLDHYKPGPTAEPPTSATSTPYATDTTI